MDLVEEENAVDADSIDNEPPAEAVASTGLPEGPPPEHANEAGQASVDPPGDRDSVSGRGMGANQQAGSVYFRDFVASNLALYQSAGTKGEKTRILQGIVQRFQESGGRFLRQDESTQEWHLLTQKEAIDKVGQRLRVLIKEQQGSSSPTTTSSCLSAPNRRSKSVSNSSNNSRQAKRSKRQRPPKKKKEAPKPKPAPAAEEKETHTSYPDDEPPFPPAPPPPEPDPDKTAEV